jgi:hypothetical protein
MLTRGRDQARSKRFIQVAEDTFLVPNLGGQPIYRNDVGSDGNGLSTPSQFTQFVPDGANIPSFRALVGKEGLFTRSWKPTYRSMEYVMRAYIGLPVSDTVIEVADPRWPNGRRVLEWIDPENGAPLIEPITGYYGLAQGANRVTGGKVQGFSIEVSRNGDGGDLTGSITYHFNRVEYNVDLPGMVAANEQKRISAESASGNGVFTFPATKNGAGGNITVTPGMTAAALQTAIRALAGYNDTGVTVTGSTTAIAGAVPVYASMSEAQFNPGGAGTITHSHTVPAGTDRCLIVKIYFSNAAQSMSAVSYGGTAMTLVRRSGNGVAVEIWRLAGSAVGTANVVATPVGSIDSVRLQALNYTGVNQTTPVDVNNGAAASSAGPVSTAVTPTVANALIIDALVYNDGGVPTVSGGATVRGGGTFSSATYGYGSEKASTGLTSQTMSWTLPSNNTWAHAVAVLAPSPGAGSSNGNYDLNFAGALASYDVPELVKVSGVGWSHSTIVAGAPVGGNILTPTGPAMHSTHAFNYIAPSDAALLAINVNDRPNAYGVGGDPRLAKSVYGSGTTISDLWNVFYSQNGLPHATDFVAGARNAGGYLALPKSMANGSDWRFLNDSEGGDPTVSCEAVKFWVKRFFGCLGFEFHIDMFASRTAEPGFEADNDIDGNRFDYGRILNANSALGSLRYRLVLPNP